MLCWHVVGKSVFALGTRVFTKKWDSQGRKYCIAYSFDTRVVLAAQLIKTVLILMSYLSQTEKDWFLSSHIGFYYVKCARVRVISSSKGRRSLFKYVIYYHITTESCTSSDSHDTF